VVVCTREDVKAGETVPYADLMSASGVGSLIQATVGSFGGVGSWCWKCGVGLVGGIQGGGALGLNLGGGAVVHRRRGVQPDTRVASVLLGSGPKLLQISRVCAGLAAVC